MMKHVRKIFWLIIILTCLPGAAVAKEWKDIIPSITTRSDVVRLFQQCHDRTRPCEFQFQGDAIRIVFSGMVQDYFYECSRNLPTDTVLLVEVTPRLPIKLKSFQQSHSLIRLAKTPDFSAYIDERAGLILKTDKNRVVQLNYVADSSRRFRCADYYKDPIKFIAVVTHCPPVTLEGPGASVTAGEIVTFKANVQPDPKMTLVWLMSDGEILTQTGREISLRASSVNGQTLKVTVQARGSCSVENSMTLQVRSHAR